MRFEIFAQVYFYVAPAMCLNTSSRVTFNNINETI